MIPVNGTQDILDLTQALDVLHRLNRDDSGSTEEQRLIQKTIQNIHGIVDKALTK